MKKTLYLILAIVTCVVFMTGCSFFSKPDDSTKDDTTLSPDTDKDTTDDVTTEDDGEEIPVDNPDDDSSEDTTDSAGENNDKTDSETDDSSNPRDNVASDASKEYTSSGKYCGFIDSNSVEIELADGSYCSFFVFDEEVRSSLSALNEEDMPEISFTYKAKEGQVNPEMTSVIGG